MKIDYAQNLRLDHGDQKLDSAGKIWFHRELTKELVKTYDVKYPGLMATSFLDVNTESQAHDKSISYKSYDMVGTAAALDDSCDTKSPRVGVGATETFRKIQAYGDSLCYSVRDLRRSQRTGKGLPDRKTAAARRMIENKLDEVACFGDPEFGITDGFLNSGNVGTTAAAGAWSTLAPDAIVAEIAALQALIDADTLCVHGDSNRLIVPCAVYTHLRFARMPDGNETLLSYIQEKAGITVNKWNRVDDAGAGGVGRAVLYQKNPELQEIHIPHATEFLPGVTIGHKFEMEAFAETAGTALYYPRTVRYLDGVS